MAALAQSALQRRKKLATYSKKTGQSTDRSALNFFEEDETSSVRSQIMPNKHKNPAARETLRRNDAKPAKPISKAQNEAEAVNEFDVPSSDEGPPAEYSVRPRLPTASVKRTLFDDTGADSRQKTLWEKQRASVHGTQPMSTTNEARQRSIIKAQAEPPEKAPGARSIARDDAAHINVEGMSALEKLAARRKLKGPDITSHAMIEDTLASTVCRSGSPSSHGSLVTPRKRKRVEATTVPSALKEPSSSDSRNPGASDSAVDEFAFPDSSAESPTTPRNGWPVGVAGIPQRSPLPSTAATSQTVGSATSALARLSQRSSQGKLGTPGTPLPRRSADSHVSDVPPQPQIQNGSSTSKPTRISTTQTPSKSGALTPKQSQLWSQLLAEDTGEPAKRTPSTLPLIDLTLSAKTVTGGSEVQRTRASRQQIRAGVRRRRMRLVDQLKALATDSDTDASESDNDALRDVEMSNDKMDLRQEPASTEEDTEISQSQSHQPTPVESGSRITYAQQRSHLAEDNIQDAMLLDMPSDVTGRPLASDRRTGQSKKMFKSSTFDIEGSDEEDTAGKVRSVHELRAAGKTYRVKAHIEDLLSDASNHAISARSRRRSALLELAGKLLDRTYCEQFLQNSFETHLLAECNSPPDIIADTMIAAACLVLLSLDLPGHALHTFKQVIPWMIRTVDVRQDVAKIVRERKNNMSKAAQSDLLAFVEKLKPQESLWGQQMPSLVQPRTLALRALDLLVSKLRQSGDQSDLILTDALTQIVTTDSFGNAEEHDMDQSLDSSLVISILESLSTFGSTSAWPRGVMDKVAALPKTLNHTWNAPQHTRFLAYRLCLNVTNDDSIDHVVFSQLGSVQSLLRTINEGFNDLGKAVGSDEEQQQQRALRLDLLVLGIGIMINLAERSAAACQEVVKSTNLPTLSSLIKISRQGHEQALEADSVEASASNVAYGYLSVMLANLCQDAQARQVIASHLPHGKLKTLVEAVQEFVTHHQKVDTINFEGADGAEVWSSFTGRLQDVLVALRKVVLEHDA